MNYNLTNLQQTLGFIGRRFDDLESYGDNKAAFDEICRQDGTTSWLAEIVSSCPIKIRDHARHDQSLRILRGHADFITSCAVTREGQFCISGSDDYTLRVWNLKTGETLHILEGHIAPVTSCAVTQDGKFCISGSSDRTLRVWDLMTGETKRIFEGHDDQVTSCAVTKDGKFCISGSNDCTLRVWDLKSGKTIKVLEGHDSWVTSCAVTKDDQFCISGSNDCTLRVWDLESGQCLLIYPLMARVCHLALARDHLVSVVGPQLLRFTVDWDAIAALRR